MRHAFVLCQALVWGSLACSAARTPDVGVNAAVPKADVDADAAADSGEVSALGSCSPIGSCPAYSFGIWQELIKASDFGAGARLVASGGLAVLVALPDGRYRIARSADPGETFASTDWDFPNASAAARPLGISMLTNPADLVSVLTCGDGGAHCSVWQADVRSDELGAWREAALPESFIGRGLTQDLTLEDRRVCVYGSGMECLGQRWESVIPESDSLRLNAAVFGSPWSAVVGDHGRWFKRDSGAWEEQVALSDVALDQVDVTNDGGAVIMGEGKLQAALGSQTGLFDCLLGRDVAVLTLDYGMHGLAYAVTSAGLIAQYALRAEPYCAYQQLTLSGPVLHSDALGCGASDNPRILTQSALFGQNSCVEVP